MFLRRFSVYLFASLLVSPSLVASETEKTGTIMDEGQCRPQYDRQAHFWGYDCLFHPNADVEAEPVHVKIAPQFSWASPFIDGRAKVLIGCRLASCRHEPGGREYNKRLYVFIDKDYDFTPKDPYDPEIWNPGHYAIFNESFSHVGHFSRDYPGLACVAYKKTVAYINIDGNIVFSEKDKGRISVRLTPQLKDFLEKNKIGFSTENHEVVIESTPEVMDFIVGRFEPPLTPATATHKSSG